ncbi:hypothetical protein FQN50_007089 [Emmonsiellopsis sp. PD_5]|nr:hypothetical protein FQN50_007089 [Emmonsiellopsis sp. PD_5]
MPKVRPPKVRIARQQGALPSNAFSSAISAAMVKRPKSAHQGGSHITSRTLCDDIIERIGTSLNKHSGCDIIDILPGAGLFSSKLHDHLKPRRHILIEPNKYYYDAFLKPLVEGPESRYKHLSWDPYDLTMYTELFDQGHLPEQSKRPLLSQGAPTLNDSLLVLANLTSPSPFKKQKAGLLVRYMEACLEQTMFHRYGLVRVLALLPSEDSEILLPRIIPHRKRTAALAEAVSAEMTEVAGDTKRSDWIPSKGWTTFNTSIKQVQQRSESSNIKTPAGREPAPLRLAPDLGVYNRGVKHIPRARSDWQEEFVELLERKERSKKVPSDALSDTDFTRFTYLRSRIVNENREEMAFRKLEPELDQIRKREADLLSVLKTPRSSVNKVVRHAEAVQEAKQLFNQQFDDLGRQTRGKFDSLAEEKGCFDGTISRTKEPLLQWDRRPYEPLHLDPEEVTPNRPCAVVDFQPNPELPMIQTQQKLAGNKSDLVYHRMVRTYLHVLGLVTTHNVKPFAEILRLMFPGRSMANLIRSVPSLAPFASPKVIQMTNSKEPMNILVFAPGPDGKRIKNVIPELAEYDDNCFPGIKVRNVPSSVLWDIVVEYESSPGRSGDMFSALGGGTLGPDGFQNN